MSLVILMILTLLGVTAMGTASLEEKMAGNTQEGVRAFEVAESGLQQSISDATMFSLSGGAVAKKYPSLNGRVPQVTSTYLQITAPPRGSGYDNNFDAYHFQQRSEVNATVDSANTGLNTAVTRGIAQIANKTN
jgi:Tfp pilus assembly protein PilX